MARYVDQGVLLADHLHAQFHEAVLDARDRALVAGDGLGRKDDDVPLLQHHPRVAFGGDARKGRPGLSLAARA